MAFPPCSEVERSGCTGLLACDESTGTVGTRLEANGMENTEENRMTWRNLLFTTPGIEQVSRATAPPAAALRGRV